MIPIAKPFLGEEEVAAAKEVLSLPMFPELSLAQQQRVVQSLCQIVGRR